MARRWLIVLVLACVVLAALLSALMVFPTDVTRGAGRAVVEVIADELRSDADKECERQVLRAEQADFHHEPFADAHRAIEICDEALSEEPDDPQRTFRLARAFDLAKAHDKALVFYKRA